MTARILSHFGVRFSMLDVRCFPSVQAFQRANFPQRANFITLLAGFISRKRGFISIQRRCRTAWWTVSQHPDVGALVGKLDLRMNSHLDSVADWASLARDARYRSLELALLMNRLPSRRRCLEEKTPGLRKLKTVSRQPGVCWKSVAAGILPAVEPRLPARRSIISPALRPRNFSVPRCSDICSGRQDAALYGRRGRPPLRGGAS